MPDVVAATLTPDDVRRILDFQLEYFQRKGVTGNGSTANPPGDVVVGGAETVDYILERAPATGEAYLPEQVHAVIETQLAYLRAIGAVGHPPAGAGRRPTGPLRRDGSRQDRSAAVGNVRAATLPSAVADLVQNRVPEKGGGPADAR